MARKKPNTAVASPYSVHPGVAMVAKWAGELPEKTGRSLDDWVSLLEKDGPKTDKERRDWLKSRHKFGTNAAWWIVERAAKGDGWEDGDPAAYLKAAAAYVETMYAGPKAGLRPLHDRLIAAGRGLGPDVRVCPCKTIVPFYRTNVFAQIKPATRTRIDLGFALGDRPLVGRLLDTGGVQKKNRITRRIPITSPADIDAEVTHWLKTAYDMDA